MDQIKAASDAMRETSAGGHNPLAPALLHCGACARLEMFANPIPGTCPACHTPLVPVPVSLDLANLPHGLGGLTRAA